MTGLREADMLRTLNARAPLYRRRQRGDVVAAIDVGTRTIACVLVERHQEAGSTLPFRVLTCETRPSAGYRSGRILALDAAEQAVRQCVHAAESAANRRAQSAVLTVSGRTLMSKHLKAQLEIPGAEVSEAQRDRVMDTLHARAQAREGELLHEELTAFIVDDADEVIEPAGLFADRLAAGLLAIWAERASLSNLINAVERAHLDVEACVPGAYAAGLAVLHVEEADVGGVVVDMGAAHTSFAYFAGNRLRAADVTPVGGDHITHDLAHAFSYSREGAETLKVKQGVANMASSLALDPVELEEGLDLNGRPPDSGIIAGVIGPRVEETFELLRDRLRDAGVPGNVKILLTGGASQLNGVEHYARKILGRRTRLALPRALRGAPQLTRQAAFAGAVGTAIRAMMAPQPERRRLRAGGRGRSVWRWLVDNF